MNPQSIPLAQPTITAWANEISLAIGEPPNGNAAKMFKQTYLNKCNGKSMIDQFIWLSTFSRFIIAENDKQNNRSSNNNNNNNNNSSTAMDGIDFEKLLYCVKHVGLSNQINVVFNLNQHIQTQTNHVQRQTIHNQHSIDTQFNTHQNVQNSTINMITQNNTNVTNFNCTFVTGLYLYCIHYNPKKNNQRELKHVNLINKSMVDIKTNNETGALSLMHNHCNAIVYHKNRKKKFPSETTAMHLCGNCFDNPRIRLRLEFEYDIKHRSFSEGFIEHLQSTHLGQRSTAAV